MGRIQLNEEELKSLKTQQFNSDSISVIEKIVRDNIMCAFHDALCLIDGVTDPNPSLLEDNKVWLGLSLTEVREDFEEESDFLHDQLFDSYWEWLDLRGE
ncbi:hypothetical protein [Chengkuizengella sediminis]|uniref:hypothetical protein n=1 Tax=Chengkuizengella sediminis TaxID=1885917 RepID=UPI00138A1A17|nr:hypothetical protein [Chengkuizengella sediminis]NDI35764.1 hypothetical protein [Chengkuizengella sediminis]